MAPVTEAAGLLGSGAMYPRRVGFRTPAGSDILVGFKAGGFSTYVDDAPIFHFDLDGRWQRAFIEGVHYLKGLDTAVEAIDRVREGENLVLRRRTLAFAEASDLDAAIRVSAIDLIGAIDSDQYQRLDPPPPALAIEPDALRAMLESIAGWDASAWFARREHYLGTYGPIPLVPPDCRKPVILQATLGHSDGRAFGAGPSAESYVRSADEFAHHAREVARLLGRRLLQCRDVLLAGPDALHRPVDEVAAWLDSAAEVFPIRPDAPKRPGRAGVDDPVGPRLDGVHAVLDDIGPPLPDRAGWALLASKHLRRVHIGVESGDPAVRALYGRTWDDAALPAVAGDMKAARLGIGVTLLVGAGGVEHADAHLDASARAIDSLPLGPGDVVALIDADEVGGVPTGPNPFTPLGASGLAAQRAALRERLAAFRARTGAKVIPYSLAKQEL